MPECVWRILQQAVIATAALMLVQQAAGGDVEAGLKNQLNTTQNQDLLEDLTELLLTTGAGEKPNVQALQRPCGAEHEGYCVNGVCSYAPDLDSPSCRCNPSFTGSRCEHVLLNTQKLSSPEEVIGVTCGVLLLLLCIVVLLYCFWRKRVSRSNLTYKHSAQHNPA